MTTDPADAHPTAATDRGSTRVTGGTEGTGGTGGGATAAPEPRKRGGCLRKVLIGVGVVLAVLVLAAVALVVTKPWYTTPEVIAPVAGARRVTDDRLLANYYPGPGSKGPAVLLYGGSDGGISAGVGAQAEALRKEGFSVLALSYWGGPDQSPAMHKLPLETFEKGLAWLGRQPEVDPAKIGLMGSSKGGEATVLLASRHPELKAAVAFVPSSVVWAGIDLYEPWNMPGIGSTWSSGGQPVPFLPYARSNGNIFDTYKLALDALPPDHPSIIPVERAKAALLLVCGEADTLWPSCPMAKAIEQRARKGGPAVTTLSYRGAGHFAGGPPLAREHPAYTTLGSLGGTAQGDNAARTDGWPKVVTHLKRHLA